MTCKAQHNLLLLCTPYLLFTLFPIASSLFLKHASPLGHLHMLIPWNVLPPLVTWLVPKSVSGLGSNVNLSGRSSLTVLFKALPALPTLSLLYFPTQHKPLSDKLSYFLFTVYLPTLDYELSKVYILFCPLIYSQHLEQCLACIKDSTIICR